MKKYVIHLIFLLGLVPFANADYIVLTNGKKFEVEGSYEVKGSFLVFTDKTGHLRQLPLKVVDLDKSKELTEKIAAKRAAEAEAKLAPPKKKKETHSMADVVDFVEKSRGGQERTETVVLGDETLKSFTEENPNIANDKVATEDYEATGAKEFHTNRDSLAREMQRLKGEKEKLDSDIDRAEKNRDLNANSAAFDDGGFYDENTPTDDPDASPAYEQMEKAEARINDLKKKREELETEITKVRQNARAQGIMDVDRHKPPPEEKAATAEGEESAETPAKARVKGPPKTESRDRYGRDGKRKSIHGDDYKSQRKGRTDDKKTTTDDRYDANGKRKKIDSKQEN